MVYVLSKKEVKHEFNVELTINKDMQKSMNETEGLGGLTKTTILG